MFIRQPRPVEADVLGGIGDGDGLLVEHRERALVIRRDEQPQSVDAIAATDVGD